MPTRAVVAAVLMSVLFSSQSSAQTEPLSQMLTDTLLKGVTMTSTTTTVAGNPHEAHFIAALGQTPAPFVLNKLMVEQLGTFPLGSASGGFVFNFDPATGLFNAASQSFGPGFAERALTNGRGRFGFGMNYQHLEFHSYEVPNLQNGDLRLILQHNDCCAVAGNAPPDPEDPFFEGDLVNMSLSVLVKQDIFAPFVSYGLNNRWDVGVAFPLVRVQLSPSITSTIDRISTCPDPSSPTCNKLVHSWDGQGQTTKTETLSGSAAGFGDIILRTKYRFIDVAKGGIGAGVDVRVPTGDKENLLGTGAVQTRVMLIASGEFSRVAPHFNLGYTYSHGDISSSLTTLPTSSQPANPATQSQINAVNGLSIGGDLRLPNEVSYTGGVDVAAHPLLTISGDLIGRTLLGVERFSRVPD